MEEAEEDNSEKTAFQALGGFKVAEQLRALSVAAEGAVEDGEGGKAAPSPECGPVGIPSASQGLTESAGASLDEGGPALEGAAMEEGAPLLGKDPSSQWDETERRVRLGEGTEPAPGPEGEGGSLALGPKGPPQPQLDVNDGSDRKGKEASSIKISGSSSESESDTDSDSSSSDSSSSSCLPMLSEDDDQQNEKEDNTCSATKNGELPKQESLCIEDLRIILPESVELMPFGKVSSIIGHLVIVESQKGMPPVNEDTVLFRGDRHSVGKIFEVFGPVSHPFYVLQFNNPEHIEAKGIKIHDAVYFAPSVESFTQYIFPEKLKQERGSDASWKNDEEPPPEAVEFSDDEKERTAKQQKKSQNLRRKKFKTQDYDKNGIDYQPRQHYHSDYSDRREPHSTFSRGRYPHPSASPRFFRHQGRTPQQHSSSYAEQWKPSAFHQQQRPDNLRINQYSFPPPSFETEANFAPSPQPATWGWPPGYTQNAYDPLLSLLSLPPPPPPPLPPPSAPFSSMNPP